MQLQCHMAPILFSRHRSEEPHRVRVRVAVALGWPPMRGAHPRQRCVTADHPLYMTWEAARFRG